METNKKVTEIMRAHHLVISKLLLKLEAEMQGKNSEKIKAAFLDFKKNMERHFYEEENVVFRFCEKINQKNLEISMTLIQQHKTMLNMLNAIEVDINNGLEINDSDFKKMHLDHVNIEEIIFYPELDIVLTDAKKKNILKRIEELA